MVILNYPCPYFDGTYNYLNINAIGWKVNFPGKS